VEQHTRRFYVDICPHFSYYALANLARKGRDLEGDYPGLDWHGNGDIVAFVPR
jgi:hypothetical protein